MKVKVGDFGDAACGVNIKYQFSDEVARRNFSSLVFSLFVLQTAY